MNRRGFALLAVLWVVAAVGGAVGLGLAGERLGQRATENRIRLARGRWAAEACLAVVQARWGTARAREADALDLGRSTRCSWAFDDPTARVNVNVAPRSLLARLFEHAGIPADSASNLADDVLARRSRAVFTSTAQLSELRGFPVRLLPLLTADGPGTVNVNAAPAPVLEALPGFTEEAVLLVASRRAAGRPLGGLDDLAGALSPPGRAALLERYADLAALVTFASSQLILTAQGWVAGPPPTPRATIELLVVPLPGRLATIRRRMS